MRALFALLSVTTVCACSTTKKDSLTPTDLERKHRSFEFTYEARIDAPPAGAKDVRLWIPLPIDTPDQSIQALRVEGSHPIETNYIERGFGRSAYITSPGEPVWIKATFEVTRYETTGGMAAYAEAAKCLGPDAMIPLDGKVAQQASTLNLEGGNVEKSWALYQHTLERMRYSKDGDQWGRGDAEWACDARYGNCTDFHSYFIGLARAKGIPARFEMGFPIPAGGEAVAKVGGYHCWAYFHSNEHGWVPVDISEADKMPEKAEYFFGTLDEHRVTMTCGRDLLLTPLPKKGALNLFVYPYAEVDGAEFEDVAKSFSRRNL
jgi:transglutaminase-like putative cysteine protease